VKRVVSWSSTRTVVVASMVAGCASCGSFLEPDRLEGAYALQAIDAAPLPVITPSWIDAEAGWETSVVADTLTFESGGRGHWRSIWRRRVLADGAEEQLDVRLPFRYVRDGMALTVVFQDCTRSCRSVFSESARRSSGDELSRARGGDWRYVRVKR
jgi:hypothetical protein